MKNNIKILIVLLSLTVLISAGLGLFYTNNGESREVTNIYGETVELYGDGIYANDSHNRALINKGTDMGLMIIASALLILVFFANSTKAKFVIAGLSSTIMYASLVIATAVTFNSLFLIYIIQLGISFFLTLFLIMDINKKDSFKKELYEKKLLGTSIFLIIGGLSTLTWLSFIVPANLKGSTMSILEIYSTEPTFVIDLAIILPIMVYIGLLLLKKQKIAYNIAPLLLTFMACIGLVVVSQTMVSLMNGVILSAEEILKMIAPFIVLGFISSFLNYKMLKLAIS